MRSHIWTIKPHDQTVFLQRGTRSSFRWHHHEYCEIFIATDGSGRTVVGDYRGRVGPGQVYLVGPFLPHAFYSLDRVAAPHEGMTFLVLEVALERFCHAMPELDTLADLHARSRRGLRFGPDTAATILDLFDQTADTDSRTHLAVLAFRVLSVLAEADDAAELVSPQWRFRSNDQEYARINQVTEYLHRHYTQAIRLDRLARHVHISQATLCRLFKRVLGQTVVEYVQDLRIRHACELLRDTRMPITGIALEVGFNSLSNFNRTFRRLKNTNPGRFRKSQDAAGPSDPLTVYNRRLV